MTTPLSPADGVRVDDVAGMKTAGTGGVVRAGAVMAVATLVSRLTGFLSKDGKTTRGRPTWVAFAQDGALLVTDDTAGIVWRVTAPGAAPAPAIERVSGERLPPQRELRGQEASFGADFARETPE